MKTKVFYNGVIQEDLFFTIYDYLRFHPDVARTYYHVLTIDDFDNLSCEDWKDVAEDAIKWLESKQLPKVHIIGIDDNSPDMDTWGTLYYQTLAYMMRSKNHYTKTIRTMNLDEIVSMCKECIEDFKHLVSEIHEPTDEEV